MDAGHDQCVRGSDATLCREQTRLRRADGAGLLPDVCRSQLLCASDASVMCGGSVMRMPAELQPGALRHVCSTVLLRSLHAELRSSMCAKLSGAQLQCSMRTKLSGSLLLRVCGSVRAELPNAMHAKLSNALRRLRVL